MQLLVAVVQAEDADVLVDRLVGEGFRVTRLNSEGSFLARGNATIFLGVEEAQIDRVFAVMRATCRTRRSFINPLPQGTDAPHLSLMVPMPLEVQIGGAIVFSFPVERFLRLQGGADLPPSDRAALRSQTAGGAQPMNLILVVVQNDDADSVTRALLADGYRLTRINTAGGFLRRGNATLLIGVEADRVDSVLKVIQTNCQQRAQANPPASGMPMYSATVFVLEASNFVRM